MNRLLTTTLLTLSLLLLALAASWLWKPPATPIAARKPRQPVEFPAKKKEAVVMSQDLEWGGLSEEELHQFSDHFGNSRSPGGFKLKKVVKSGEVIVADVYEARKGEFVCSKITPTLKQKDGQLVVEMNVELLTLTPSGEQQVVISANKKEMLPRGLYEIGNRTRDGMHTITLSASADGATGVKVEAEAKYKSIPDKAAPDKSKNLID